jgi:hypothetical protein
MKTLLLKIAFAGGLMLATGGMAHDEHAGASGVSPRDHGAPAERASPHTPGDAKERPRGGMHGEHGMGGMMDGMGMMDSMMNMMSRMMGGGMMEGCPMMGGGSDKGEIGGARPHQQWRSPEPAR